MYADRRLADTNLTCQNIEPENELPTVTPSLLSSRESVTIVAYDIDYDQLRFMNYRILNSSNGICMTIPSFGTRDCHVYAVRLHVPRMSQTASLALYSRAEKKDILSMGNTN